MTKPYDYLVVGLGLAGTCLTFTLNQKYGRSVFVIDRDAGKKCSSIAAGTFNPIAFKTFSPTWRAIEFIPFLQKFYSEVEELLGIEILNDRSVLKSFRSEDQKNLWKKKSLEMPSSQFMHKECLNEVDGVFGEKGFGSVKNSGNINMKKLLISFRSYLLDKERISEEDFNYLQLEKQGEHWKYGPILAKKVVFCQGYDGVENPFFNELPFKQTKGEVLIIEAPKWDMNNIVHNGINIIPMGEHKYWVGSTFDWNDTTTKVTQKGKEDLLTKIRQTLSVDFKVVDHLAGVRPTVKDRRPVLGEHPQQKHLYILNGLGTRGVMIAPFFANELALNMEEGKEIEREVNYRRFI